MEIRNLNEDNVEKIEDLVKKLKLENSSIESTVFSQAIDPFKTEVKEKLDHIQSDINGIKHTLKHIFDGHVLINGKFI